MWKSGFFFQIHNSSFVYEQIKTEVFLSVEDRVILFILSFRVLKECVFQVCYCGDDCFYACASFLNKHFRYCVFKDVEALIKGIFGGISFFFSL